MTRVGIVTGLAAEARLIDRHSPDPTNAANDAPLIACAGPGRGREAADRLIARGATALLSFGLAGGLDPWLKPGDLVCPGRILSADREALPADPQWHGHVMADARTAGMEIADGALFGYDRPVAEAGTKHRLANETGAVAVDMESHSVAAVAAAHGLPFVALRAIADTADRSLPPAALAAVDAEGRIRAMAVTLALLRGPGQIPAMIELARGTRAGMTSLRRAAGLRRLVLGLR